MDKFLRRNSYSSDERDNSTPITTKSRNKTKSLESLTDNKKDQTAKSPKSLKSSPKAEDVKPKSMEQAKVVVKQSAEKLDKKKSQFNYESVIEITLPSAPTQPQPIADTSAAEEPIKPIICTPKMPPHNNSQPSPSSAHESAVSNKQNPMEWDSFIPVSCFAFPSRCHQHRNALSAAFRATSRQHNKTFNYAIRWSSAIAN